MAARAPNTGSSGAYPELIRREVQRLNANVGYIEVKTMQERLDPQVRPWRLGATMFVIFGVLALLIAGSGCTA
jgi:hypothetical protein